MRTKNNKGFTIIELIVVIAIVAVLATIIITSVNQFQAKARDAKRKADISQIVKGLGMYYILHGSYPANSYGGACGTALNGADLISQGLKNDDIMSKIPSAPSNSGACGDAYYSGTWNGTPPKAVANLTKLENNDQA